MWVKMEDGSYNCVYGLMHVLDYEIFMGKHLANIWSVLYFSVLSVDGDLAHLWPYPVLLFQSLDLQAEEGWN